MEASELALIELLDHLGRQAARWRIPAPRKVDSVADWCQHGEAEEDALRSFLVKQYPHRRGEFTDLRDKATSFEALMRGLVRSK